MTIYTEARDPSAAAVCLEGHALILYSLDTDEDVSKQKSGFDVCCEDDRK